MKKRFSTMLVCSLLFFIVGAGGSWAGPFDGVTKQLKKAVSAGAEGSGGQSSDQPATRDQNKGLPTTTVPAGGGPVTGNIVFAKSPIEPGNPPPFTSEFKIGDPIYAAAYLGKPLRTLTSDPQTKKVYVEISFWRIRKPLYSYQQPSEQFIAFNAVNITGSILENEVLPFEILPSAEGMTSYGNPEMNYRKFGKKADGPVKIAESLSKLEAGQHGIVFKVKINYKDVAKGMLSLEGTDFTKLAALAEDYRKTEVTQATAGAEMPKAAMNDRKLEGEMITALKASRTYNERMKGQILRFVIVDPDWIIRRHSITGVIAHRYIRAAAAIKDDKGECRVWNLITFQQDYVGGRFQKTKFDGVGDATMMKCENIK